MSELEKDVEGAVKADFNNIPVPPEGAEGEAPAAEAVVAKAEADNPIVAALAFTNPAAMTTTIPFEHPFEWNGTTYNGVTAHRLSYAEVAAVYEQNKDGDGEVKLIHFYAAMTGLPAPVIRGMEGGDSQAIVEACGPFLPRQLRTGVS